MHEIYLKNAFGAAKVRFNSVSFLTKKSMAIFHFVKSQNGIIFRVKIPCVSVIGQNG